MKEAKVFTLEEANGLLPQLSELLAVLRSKGDEIGHLEVKIDAQELVSDPESELRARELGMLTKKHQSLISQFYQIVDEIHSHGCFLKDVDVGLIDFYGSVNGKVVFYCWLLGEEKVSFWHEVDKGFASREQLLES